MTVLYVLLDPAGQTVTIGRAGHLPPLAVSPSGSAAFLEDGLSPPLGVPVQGRRQSAQLDVAGAVLVLYSDGLVEEPSSGIGVGMTRLAEQAVELAAEHLHDLEVFCDGLLTVQTATARADDVTLLAVRLPIAAG